MLLLALSDAHIPERAIVCDKRFSSFEISTTNAFSTIGSSHEIQEASECSKKDITSGFTGQLHQVIQFSAVYQPGIVKCGDSTR